MTSERDKPKPWQFGIGTIFVAVLLIACTLPPCIGLYKAWHFAAIGSQLNRVDVGMTKAELLDRWGAPRRRGRSTWTYWLGSSQVDVYFDDNGCVSQVDS